MSALPEPLDVDALEERAFRSRFDDGLADLCLGVMVLAMGLSMETEYAGMIGVWPAMAIALWAPMRKLVTEPRMGYAEFGPGRRAKVRARMLVMTVVLGLGVLGGVALWMVNAAEPSEGGLDALRSLGPLPFTGMLALMVAVAAGLLRLPRGYAYAVLILGASVAGHLTGASIRPPLIASGVVVLACGAVVLVRFLRRYPRPAEDGPDGEV